MKIIVGKLAILLIGSISLALDVKLIGPGGEVIIYYKETGTIVIRNCGNSYPLIKKLSDCTTVGKENRVPIEAFKRALESEFEIKVDEFKATTQAEDSRLAGLSSQKETLEAKLRKIKDFVAENNSECDSQCKQDQSAIRRSLDKITNELAKTRNDRASLEKLNAGLKSMDAIIDDLIDKKIGSSGIIVVSFTKDPATFVLLKNFDASLAECGTDEIIDRQTHSVSAKRSRAVQSVSTFHGLGELMDDSYNVLGKDYAQHIYNNRRTGQSVVWKLVSRKRNSSTGKFYEVWQDPHSGALWGDKLDSKYNQEEAEMSACNHTEEGARSDAGVKRTFRLPSEKEFVTATEDGMTEVLPNSYNAFWTSDHHDFFRRGQAFDGDHAYPADRLKSLSVRCIWLNQ